MGVYRIENRECIASLFDGCEDTMVWSCLQGHMGIAYADHPTAPTSAQVSIGDICFFAGVVHDELVRNKPQNLSDDFAILVPPDQAWAQAIERVYCENVKKHIRYATKKEPDIFCTKTLADIVVGLPVQYEITPIYRAEYEEILSLDWAIDLCGNYACYEDYGRGGLGFVIRKNGVIVSGASSYTFYDSGIEIEIDTREDERRKGLASICGAKLILECLDRNLYPSWDAHTKDSLALAQKLGYRFAREYLVYLMGRLVW